MQDIKFGTDGWRAIIAKEYTVKNVQRVADATARWMISKDMKKVIIGYDCRFGGEMFASAAADVLSSYGIDVVVGDDVVSTPMVSLAVVKENADMGIVITASHNPPSYNGFKLKSAYGGTTIVRDIQEVEALIQDDYVAPTTETKGDIEKKNLENIYFNHVVSTFDLESISQFGDQLAYDAMYGAGQNIMQRIFPQGTHLHCEYNPSFAGTPPEPIHKNLGELSETLKSLEHLKIGVANDGDADRIGMYDEDGDFVDSHHILLLLLMYLHEHKGYSGKVVVTFSVTDKMKKLAELYGLEFEVTKVGFKYIAEIMVDEDVLVGGEESGGLAVKGHIPERDGVWIALLIMEYMSVTGKTIKELIQDIYAKVGSFSFDRDDLHIANDKKWAIMDKCKAGTITTIGDRPIIKTENVDGYKFYLSDDEWVMIRPSGTEPVLRVYAQGIDADGVRRILDETHKTLG